jgi:signal transduction histidine kinase
LQQCLVIALFALIGLGVWISRTAKRAQEDSKRMQEVIGDTITAQEAERRRIAFDLHDSIAQEISAALMIARRLEENAAGSRAALVASLKSTMEAVRRISWEMRPPELERLGFQGAIIGYIDDFVQRRGLKLELLNSDWDSSGLSDEAATQLYRIVQEALANIDKHASATTVRVDIFRADDRLVLSLEDDGRGLDASSVASQGGGMGHLGIAGMRERARLMNGAFSIESAYGKGTKIRVEVPCAERGRAS